MKNKVVFILLFVLLFFVFVPQPLKVNAIPPPHMTIVVINPPSDLKLSVRYTKDYVIETVLLTRSDIAWETKFYFKTLDFLDEQELYDNFVLIVVSKDYNFEVTLPDEITDEFYPHYTLNLKAQTLYKGYPTWQMPVTASLRIVATILLECIMFFLFGYREKHSWLVFLVMNLITQGVLHLFIGILGEGGGIIYIFWFSAIIVLIAEMIVLALTLDEQSRWKAVAYAFFGNLLSLILGTYLLGVLPS